MLKYDFNEVALQLYWNCTLTWVIFCKFPAYFQNTFSYEHLWEPAPEAIKVFKITCICTPISESTALGQIFQFTKKWSFLLRISSVNATKSAFTKNILNGNFIFCAAIEKTYIYRTKTDEKLNILVITCFIKPKIIFMEEAAQ